MPNGGAVYYENYLNTRTEVYQTYLDEEATNDALNGTLGLDVIDGLVSVGLGKIWWPLGAMHVAANIYDNEIAREIRNGTGRMEIMHSDDGDTSATIKLHWHTAPYVTVYNGWEASIP